MTEFDDIPLDRVKEYKGIIAIEQLMARQIDRVMEYGSQMKNASYEEAVEHLIDLAPPGLETKALEFKKEHGVYYDEGPEGKLRYRALFRFIKHLLAESNIVWKKTSYEKGKEG